MGAAELPGGFIIEPCSKRLDSGEWQPGARVFRLLDGAIHEYCPLSECGRRFMSQNEADDFARLESREWIDRH